MVLLDLHPRLAGLFGPVKIFGRCRVPSLLVAGGLGLGPRLSVARRPSFSCVLSWSFSVFRLEKSKMVPDFSIFDPLSPRT